MPFTGPGKRYVFISLFIKHLKIRVNLCYPMILKTNRVNM